MNNHIAFLTVLTLSTLSRLMAMETLVNAVGHQLLILNQAPCTKIMISAARIARYSEIISISNHSLTKKFAACHGYSHENYVDR